MKRTHEVGVLTIGAAKRVVAAIEDDSLTLHDALGVAHHALATPATGDEPSPDVIEAAHDVNRFLAELGWQAKPSAPARMELARSLASLRQLGWQVDAEVFSRYAETANALAEWELDQTPTAGPRSDVVQSVVVGTVVFEQALSALRRLAQEHQSATRLKEPTPQDPNIE